MGCYLMDNFSINSYIISDASYFGLNAKKLGGEIICNDLNVYVGTDLGHTSCVEEGPDGKP